MTTARLDMDGDIAVGGAGDGARESAAERLAPLRALQRDLEGQWRTAIDLVQARQRIRSGLTAYDPVDVIASAGDLVVPFLRATKAIETAGLASDAAVSGARDLRFEVVPAIHAWLAGERRPREAHRRAARQCAALVGGSILRRASREVLAGLSFDDWRRAGCPCCGSPAELAVASRTGRTLLCSRCDTVWPTPLTGCLGCGAAGDPMIARVPAPSIGYELTICNVCGRYVKERRAGPALDALLERMITEELDEAAERRGLRL
ncbi:MAG TPA: formate dehydrogenase accessory protein FdhE [Gemmatimonadaceae bacterium]|nr:formate dehydrogenase accessory protein FdhE [Gemmatimonadaceae bacterium]